MGTLLSRLQELGPWGLLLAVVVYVVLKGQIRFVYPRPKRRRAAAPTDHVDRQPGWAGGVVAGEVEADDGAGENVAVGVDLSGGAMAGDGRGGELVAPRSFSIIAP